MLDYRTAVFHDRIDELIECVKLSVFRSINRNCSLHSMCSIIVDCSRLLAHVSQSDNKRIYTTIILLHYPCTQGYQISRRSRLRKRYNHTIGVINFPFSIIDNIYLE